MATIQAFKEFNLQGIDWQTELIPYNVAWLKKCMECDSANQQASSWICVAIFSFARKDLQAPCHSIQLCAPVAVSKIIVDSLRLRAFASARFEHR